MMIGDLQTVRRSSDSGIEDWFFTERRLGFCASSLVAVFLMGLGWILIRHGFAISSDGTHCIDFIWMWLSSKLALSGDIPRIFDHSGLLASLTMLVEQPSCIFERFNYPPTLLLFTYPLGLMSYSTAFVVWIAATLSLYLMAIYAIIPSRTAIIAAITPVPVVINVLLGHNGFLTAGLIGLALVLLERRPWLSGIFLGLLTYKPQFGILFPLAFLASRNWRVVMSAIATSAIFALVAAIAFGHQTWPLFIDALLERASNLNEDPTLNSPLISTFGFLRARGVDVHTAWAAQLALATIVAAIVCAFWVKPLSYPLKAAALAIGSVLVAPHVISYDLCILSIAAAFLVKDGLSYGFLPGERAIMFFCWVGLILSCDISFDIFPASICAVLLVIVAGRALACGERVPKGSRALLKA